VAFTQADLDQLDADIRNFGTVESTQFDQQSTRFRPLDELLRLRAIMAADVAAATNGTRTRYAAFSKGA
jgi:hypothetical protein